MAVLIVNMAPRHVPLAQTPAALFTGLIPHGINKYFFLIGYIHTVLFGFGFGMLNTGMNVQNLLPSNADS